MNQEEFKRVYTESRNGANGFFRHPLCRTVAYSDGVKDLAETGCYWLLDILASELPSEFRKNEKVSNTCVVTVCVELGKAKITAEFEDGDVAWSKAGVWTDLPEGEWKLYVADEYEGPTRYRIILLTEY